jgi:hypothetical protein
LLRFAIACPNLNFSAIICHIWTVDIKALATDINYRSSANGPLLLRFAITCPNLNFSAIIGHVWSVDVKA